MRNVSLRRRLLVLAAAGILPLALMSGLGLLALAQQQREQAGRAGLSLTRAMATAVDAELRRSASVLASLATSQPLDVADTAGFLELARRVQQTQPEWLSVILANRSGQALANTGFAPGAPLPPLTEPASFNEVLRTGNWVVGPMAAGPRGSFGVAVRVPVARDGELRYVLTGVVRPQAILKVIQRQRIPDDWVVTVLDARGVCVARSRGQERYVGKPASPSLLQLMASAGAEGAGVTRTLEGEAVYTGFTRLADTGWVVAIGIPASAVEAAGDRSLAAYGGGLLLSLVLGGLAVMLVARSINRPIVALRRAAQALGRGEAQTIPSTSDIRELQELGHVLEASARQRAQAQAQRDELLAAERHARDAAEQARRRLELLAAAGTRLSHALEQSTALEAIAAIIVPGVADWCRVDLLDENGELRRALTHHSDPEKARRGAELAEVLRAAPTQMASMAWVVQTGRSHVGCCASPGELQGATDPDLQAFARAIGLRAYFVAPLIARGRTLGAIAALQAESGRDFSQDDCALVSELAHRAALALDNARLYAEAEAALREAQRAHRAKDEFLAMLGHELRNPLAPIVTALHLMKLRDPGEAGGVERRIIERQVSHLSRLVDDLLDVSRITQGKVQIEREHVDMKDVVARAIELTQPVLQTRSKPLELHLPEGAAAVWGDPVRLAQVLCNLLINAAKFTPADRAIRLMLQMEGAEVVTRVEDEGSGIAPELLPRVFDLFVQGEQPLSRHVGGLGLGLAIVRTLVQMHGGSVDAHSDGPGRGSCFVVRLPAAPQQAPSVIAPTVTAQPAGGASVLVVDDNADAAESLALLLDALGYQTRAAFDGASALAVLETFVPRVALLDIGLPGMDGYQLARRLKGDARLAALKLVALTGYGTDADRRRARSEGFDAHLVKPVQVEQLLAVLNELIGTAPAAVAGRAPP
ncbi:ATP-binding protein [Schlegelella sp. S2-27]|uniref:histidine kinase n=1 Tax=Caldimonas mangrovi TaxID=2944811 RepID=A0ABT0YHF3_9BURK|nr:ATP-binding protein [Caldimonas mangrovi]MCM5678147.1 ATP-binding protein [Caldimonas mangrovi]